jgi:hypothetical protein
MGTYSQLLQKPQPAIEEQEPVSVPVPETAAERPVIAGNIAIQPASNMDSNISDNIVSNIAILQFSAEDIAALRKGTYQPQTFRFTEAEQAWLREVAYQLSKDLPRGKVNQVDLLRIGLRLVHKLLATNKDDLIHILQEMK